MEVKYQLEFPNKVLLISLFHNKGTYLDEFILWETYGNVNSLKPI